jgi:hypothetical protein
VPKSINRLRGPAVMTYYSRSSPTTPAGPSAGASPSPGSGSDGGAGARPGRWPSGRGLGAGVEEEEEEGPKPSLTSLASVRTAQGEIRAPTARPGRGTCPRRCNDWYSSLKRKKERIDASPAERTGGEKVRRF